MICGESATIGAPPLSCVAVLVPPMPPPVVVMPFGLVVVTTPFGLVVLVVSAGSSVLLVVVGPPTLVVLTPPLELVLDVVPPMPPLVVGPLTLLLLVVVPPLLEVVSPGLLVVAAVAVGVLVMTTLLVVVVAAGVGCTMTGARLASPGRVDASATQLLLSEAHALDRPHVDTTPTSHSAATVSHCDLHGRRKNGTVLDTCSGKHGLHSVLHLTRCTAARHSAEYSAAFTKHASLAGALCTAPHCHRPPTTDVSLSNTQ
mmetsp:Transcript_12827/g.21841  ORF Transcript_12827/g.21841 Transcript_12827/m.21841 type:complete len:258 (+) Transcript_12827:882-1655(+)